MRLERVQVVIPVGTAISDPSGGAIIDLTEKDLVAIAMPAAWTAANITFQSTTPDPNDVTYQDVFDSATPTPAEVTIGATAAHYIVLTEPQSIQLRGLSKIKVRSGTTGTPVNQVAARTLTLIVTQIT